MPGMTLSDDTIRLLLDDGPWTDERMADLAREAGSGDAARRLVERWDSVRGVFSRRLTDLVPDPSDLVLLGLERAGRDDLLSETEIVRLTSVRESLHRAEEAMPAVSDVLSSVARDADEFDSAWRQAFAGRTARPDRPASRRPPLRRVVSRFAMAASVLAFAAVSVLLLNRDDGQNRVTADDAVRMVTLDDGSTARLLRGSSLSWREGDFDRNVTLDGRAFFSVRPGDIPFSVLTPSATVTVLGTSFGVDSRPDETEVVLVSGRVSVAMNGRPDALVVLEPGQRTKVVLGSEPSFPERVSEQAALDWTRLLFFRSTPLSEVVARLETAYGVRVTVDPALSGVLVTGTFERDRAAHDVLAVVATAVGARVDTSADGTVRLLPD